VLSVLVFLSLVSAIYTTPDDPSALTAYGVCLRLETMALFVGMGWGAAASSFVGMNLGAGRADRAKRAGWIAATYNLCGMLVLVWLYIAHSDAVVGFFDDDPHVLAVGREYFRSVGLSYLLVGVALVLSQAVNGAGATLSTLVIDAAVLFLVVPVAIVAAEHLRVPRVAFFWIIAAGNALAALAHVGWYARGSFLGKQI
jgi:Na+-driven multidrug efflux pump